MKTYLYVTPFFPAPGNWRGAYCLDFVKAVARTGRYRVEVLREGDGRDYEVDGVVVHTFRARHLPSNVFPSLFARGNARNFLAAVSRAGIDLKDIAVCHGNTAFTIHYPLAVKEAAPHCLTVMHHHDLASFGLNNGRLRHFWPYNLIQFPVLRRLHERYDVHVFVSEASRRNFLAAPRTDSAFADYRRQMWGLPYRSVRIGRSVILHNGVDRTLFNASGKASRSADSLVIGCVGNFQELKGQMTLLEAVERIGRHRMKLVFLGSGPELARCRCFAEEHGIDAEFRTEVRHEALPAFYRELDLFVLPSVFEGFGCVYTEAHACGVPFIACRGQGMDDLIPPEDRRLWLCKERDPEDLAKKIQHFHANRPAQRLTEDQDIDKLIERFLREIDRIS